MSQYFSLKQVSNHDTIKMNGSDITITVYHLEDEPFTPTAGELVFYGDDHGAFLAFQTNGFNPDTTIEDELALISMAIQWYAAYLDYPQMILQMSDPRPNDVSGIII